jgi:hypothetical protein
VEFGHPVTIHTCPVLDCRSTGRWGHTVRVTDATTSPAAPPRDPRARRLHPRHAVYALLLVIVAVSIFVLFKKSQTNGVNLGNGAIERLIPAPGSKILSQDEIGIDLAPGYEATLSLNGTPIPEDELRIVPELNQVTFKALPYGETQLVQGQQNCVVATYWLSSAGPSQSTNRSWCFSVL